jgi:hypothetical protein
VNHVWIVKQDGKELGTVEAVSRKGACHEAYEKFGIEQSKRNNISVEKAERRFLAFDLGAGESGVVCSFNPALAHPSQDKTLETCRQRFPMDSLQFLGFPRKPE